MPKTVSTKVPTVIALVANNNTTSGSNGSQHSEKSTVVTTRKDSFGSKDSLTDSGIVTGNVAAHRRSLESKATEPVVDKPPRKSFPTASSNDKMSELRKSLECLDEKKAPPVLSKKPSVPVKKSPISAAVTSNLLSGLKSKVTSSSKSLDKDNLDGVASSRMQVADNAEKHVQGERISMQSDFDHVERSTGVLKDMRANRARLPKGRRPPTGAPNSSSTDLPSLLNGGSSASLLSEDGEASQGGAASSQSEDELVKPKPREWEKNRAPWMAELKASQAKKTSPSSFDSLSKSPDSKRLDEEPHSMFASMSSRLGEQKEHHEKFDMSKSFSSSYVSSSAALTTSTSNNAAAPTVKKVESLEVSNRSQSVDVGSKTETVLRSKSMILGSTLNSHRVAATSSEESSTSLTSTATITSSSRPTSVNLRNPGAAPTVSSSLSSSTVTAASNRMSMNQPPKLPPAGDSADVLTTSTTNGVGAKQQPESDSQRIIELEQRVARLEGTVQNLVRLLRDESDKVKTLKTELDKYAQCVTQV